MNEQQRQVGKPYEGHSGIAHDSPWLTSEDLQARGKTELTVTIEHVLKYDGLKFQDGKVRRNALSLKLKGMDRELVLNKTNRLALNLMFGKLTKDWRGKQVTLFVTQTRFGRDMVDCLRIRNTASRPATAAEDLSIDDEESAQASGAEGKAAPDDAGVEPAPDADRTDADLFADLSKLSTKVESSFGGERTLLRQAPPKSGTWWTADPALADPALKLYDATTRTLLCTREQLLEVYARLQVL
jgi:hypothetical protein